MATLELKKMAKRKVKVLHVITQLVIGGAQDNTILTLEKHDRTSYEVHLASNPNGEWLERAENATDYFHPLPELVPPISFIQDIKCVFSLVRLIRSENIDIVHTHSSKAGVLGRIAAAIAKVPVVVHTIHGFAFHDFMPKWKQYFYIGLERSVSPLTDFFLTVSELNRHQAIELGIVKEDNSKTAYSGIDFSKLDNASSRVDVRNKLGISQNTPVVLMVGRLDEQKAPYFLIDAFSLVLKQVPEVILLLVGDGELRTRLETQVNELGISDNVRFLGCRQDVPDLLQACDIFALSSLWEGLGRAMTEAMLVGKPVVVPNIYGIPEIVKNEETGLLFPAGDVETLAKHLNLLISDKNYGLNLGANAKQLTRNMFSINSMVENIESVYDEKTQKVSA